MNQNDKLQIPTFCVAADSQTGLCSLHHFITSQSYALNNADGDYLEVRKLSSCDLLNQQNLTGPLDTVRLEGCLAERVPSFASDEA